MLPGMNGFETCTEIRKTQDLPIMMMSARSDDDSKLLGYETGADDYIEKPFSIPVLTAKIRALLKRSDKPEHALLSGCGITLNPVSRQVTKNGVPLRLNSKEFELLRVLMLHAGEAMSKNDLFDAVWGTDCFTEQSTVSVHIRWLREKLEDDPNQPENACAVLRYFTNLKGRLMPYLWSQANHTHETGVPMMRAMVIDYADDPACLTLDRQYLLGESLLCAPVFDESGIAEYYLPEGEWFDLLGRTDAPLVQGGKWFRRKCSYLEMPVYVRPDSIIVMGDFKTDVCYDYLANAEVLICGLGDGHTASCDLYRAEGGKELTITAKREDSRITVTYPPTDRKFTICVAGTNRKVKAEAGGTTVISL